MENLERQVRSAISNGFLDAQFGLFPVFLDQVWQCSQLKELGKLKVGDLYLWQCLFNLPLWFDGLRHYAGFNQREVYSTWREYVLPAPAS